MEVLDSKAVNRARNFFSLFYGRGVKIIPCSEHRYITTPFNLLCCFACISNTDYYMDNQFRLWLQFVGSCPVHRNYASGGPIPENLQPCICCPMSLLTQEDMNKLTKDGEMKSDKFTVYEEDHSLPLEGDLSIPSGFELKT